MTSLRGQTHTRKENEQTCLFIFCACVLSHRISGLLSWSSKLQGYVFFHISMATVGYITDSSVHHSPKNLYLRRDVNEHLCGVERSRNFRHFGLELKRKQPQMYHSRLSTTALIPFLHNFPRKQNIRRRCMTLCCVTLFAHHDSLVHLRI